MLKRISVALNRPLIFGSTVMLSVLLMAVGPPDGGEWDPAYIPTGPMEPNPSGTWTHVMPEGAEPILPPAQASAIAATLAIQCTTSTGGPDEVIVGYKRLWGAGEIDCEDHPHLAQVRLVVAMQRHKLGAWWVNVRKIDSGWQSTNYYYREFLADCANGTHTYRVVESIAWSRTSAGT